MDSSKIEVVLSKNDARKSHGGITPKVIGKFEDKKVMIKGENFEEALMECFAYRLGKTLGIPTNKVELINTGDVFGLNKYCSVHWWEDKFIVADKANSDGRTKTKTESKLLTLFDIIINNGDRHSGNYGYKNNRLFLIDNGSANPWVRFREWETRDIKDFVNSIDKDLMKVVTKFLSITPRKIKYMLKTPKGFEKTYPSEKIEMTINRFSEIQEFIKKELEFKIQNQNGGLAC
jgi:phage pi2 protein 07